jgi:hypothetical protein
MIESLKLTVAICLINFELKSLIGWKWSIFSLSEPLSQKGNSTILNFWSGIKNVFSGAFAKLQKAAISTVMFVCLSVCLSVRPSVRPSVRMEQLGSNWTDFHETWYLIIFFLNPWRKFKFIEIRQEERVAYMKTNSHFLSYPAQCSLE